MKKFYILAAAAAVALTSVASDAAFKVSKNLSALSAKASNSVVIDLKKTSSYAQKASIKADETEETWTNIGTGTWVEGPLDGFSFFPSGETHEIEVFQNDNNSNIYRFTPYAEGSTKATSLGLANEADIYIDVTDPAKVLAYGENDGDFVLFDLFTVSQCIPANGWGATANGFGNYDGAAKTISFPTNGFGVSTDGGENWYYGNTDGKFLIYLPGADVKDYSFSSTVDACGDNNKVQFSTTAGADIASVKFFAASGMFNASDDNLNFVKQSGQAINANATYNYTLGKAGLYSFFFVALDSDGNIVDGACHWVHSLDDNNSDWEEIGSGVWTDPILYSAGYYSSTPELDVVVERSISNPGRIRISSPFAPFTANYVSHSGHEHYIYIDITDPENVKVDLSLTGIAVNYGQISIMSTNNYFTDAYVQAQNLGVAKYDAESNTISFPAKSLLYTQPNYDRGGLYFVSAPGKLVIPSLNKVPDALSIVGDVTSEIEMVKDGNSFTAVNVVFTAAEGSSYASFTLAAEGANYGAVADDTILTAPTSADFEKAETAKAWLLLPGNYDVTVDFDTMTISINANLSGIETVTTNANAAAEYFNLRGIRVAEPVNGGLYIVRQGSKVSKIVK